jgi:hypothetical protein
MLTTQTVISTPNPGAGAVSAATGVSAILGYGASLVATKWGVPPEVTISVLTGAATLLTSLWHHLFGPKTAVTVPAPPSQP